MTMVKKMPVIQSAATKARTSTTVVPEILTTREAIREAMPMGEKAMTKSVIFSMTSVHSSMRRDKLEAFLPRKRMATPRNMAKTMICSMFCLTMASTIFSGNQETTLLMKL